MKKKRWLGLRVPKGLWEFKGRRGNLVALVYLDKWVIRGRQGLKAEGVCADLLVRGVSEVRRATKGKGRGR